MLLGKDTHGHGIMKAILELPSVSHHLTSTLGEASISNLSQFKTTASIEIPISRVMAGVREPKRRNRYMAGLEEYAMCQCKKASVGWKLELRSKSNIKFATICENEWREIDCQFQLAALASLFLFLRLYYQVFTST